MFENSQDRQPDMSFRELTYHLAISRKLKERGVNISELLKNHHDSNFTAWYMFKFFGSLFTIPDKLEDDGCSRKTIEAHEKAAERYVDIVVREICEKVKELGLPLPSEGSGHGLDKDGSN